MSSGDFIFFFFFIKKFYIINIFERSSNIIDRNVFGSYAGNIVEKRRNIIDINPIGVLHVNEVRLTQFYTPIRLVHVWGTVFIGCVRSFSIPIAEVASIASERLRKL